MRAVSCVIPTVHCLLEQMALIVCTVFVFFLFSIWRLIKAVGQVRKTAPAASLQSYTGASKLNVKRFERSTGGPITRSGRIPRVHDLLSTVQVTVARWSRIEQATLLWNLNASPCKVSAFRKNSCRQRVQIFQHASGHVGLPHFTWIIAYFYLCRDIHRYNALNSSLL